MTKRTNKDKTLLRVAEGFRVGILAGRPSKGFCFAICLPLHSYIRGYLGEPRAQLIERHFYRLNQYDGDETTNHFWIELEDGRILDPTADQFERASGRYPSVYLGPLPNEYRAWMEAGELRLKAKALATKPAEREAFVRKSGYRPSS